MSILFFILLKLKTDKITNQSHKSSIEPVKIWSLALYAIAKNPSNLKMN